MPRHPRFGSRKRGEEGGEREVRKRRSGGPLTGTSGNNGEGTVKSGKERERERKTGNDQDSSGVTSVSAALYEFYTPIIM